MKEGNDLVLIPVLVEPLYQGNIGSMARLSRNFGMDSMILINPPDLEDEAYAYSMHGKPVLESAKVYGSLKEVEDSVDLLVGTSGVTEVGEKNYRRNPMTPEELGRWVMTVRGKVGICFGREDQGLSKDELELCDVLVTIPADPDYPILNISHAAGIVLYQLWRAIHELPYRNARTMNGLEKRVLLEHYDRLMKASNVPPHKRPIARTNFRRMIARAAPNYREFNSLMGTFSRAMDYKRKRSPYGPGDTD